MCIREDGNETRVSNGFAKTGLTGCRMFWFAMILRRGSAYCIAPDLQLPTVTGGNATSFLRRPRSVFLPPR